MFKYDSEEEFEGCPYCPEGERLCPECFEAVEVEVEMKEVEMVEEVNYDDYDEEGFNWKSFYEWQKYLKQLMSTKRKRSPSVDVTEAEKQKAFEAFLQEGVKTRRSYVQMLKEMGKALPTPVPSYDEMKKQVEVWLREELKKIYLKPKVVTKTKVTTTRIRFGLSFSHRRNGGGKRRNAKETKPEILKKRRAARRRVRKANLKVKKPLVEKVTPEAIVLIQEDPENPEEEGVTEEEMEELRKQLLLALKREEKRESSRKIPKARSRARPQKVAHKATGSSRICARFCRFILKGQWCPHKRCFFAHTLSQLIPCAFRSRCRAVRCGYSSYVNSSKWKGRPCSFIHPGENRSSYFGRMS